MLRRCAVHDYRRPAIYMVTVTLADRSRPILGRLVGGEGDAKIDLSPIGEIVAREWQNLAGFMPGVEPLDFQVMPDHFHGLLRVTRLLPKPIGAAIGAFKVRCTQGVAQLTQSQATGHDIQPQATGHDSRPQAAGHDMVSGRLRPGSPGLWSPGYQDSIAFDSARLARMIAYIRDNPRRLAVKRAHRDLFKVVARLPFGDGAFMALGNRFLLRVPLFHQIQCSRSITPVDLERKKNDCSAAIKRGAVIVSPCISPGEKEIAKEVFEAKGKLIVLKNKGFAPLYKPSGEMFDACAEGRILQLVPIAWKYVPGKKPLTRFDACVMNRLAQLICKEDAAEINYRGMTPAAIDEWVKKAMMA